MIIRNQPNKLLLISRIMKWLRKMRFFQNIILSGLRLGAPFPYWILFEEKVSIFSFWKLFFFLSEWCSQVKWKWRSPIGQNPAEHRLRSPALPNNISKTNDCYESGLRKALDPAFPRFTGFLRFLSISGHKNNLRIRFRLNTLAKNFD